ncbi:MAG: hypothetical protein AAFP76_11765 [Bacteroidota bacterium]
MTEKSKSFNPSFDAEFCTTLEFRLCREFDISKDDELRRFWCDGVSWAPFYSDKVNEEYLSAPNVLKENKIQTTAWLGVSGQDRYELTIWLGSKSRSNYKLGISLLDCVPEIESDKNWVTIDVENQKIQIILD